MTKKMNKSQRIAAFVNEKPEVMPKIIKTAHGTSIWRGEKDYLVMDVSVSYAYQIARGEHRKFLRAKYVSNQVESTTTGTPKFFSNTSNTSGLADLTLKGTSTPTEPPKPEKPKRTAWQRLVRKLTVRWGRLVKKFMRLTGLYTETK